MTYSNDELELFWLRYQAEGIPQNISLQDYCSRNKVPYNLVRKWYKDTRHRITEVCVAGKPESVTEAEGKKENTLVDCKERALRILVDIRMSNGLRISKGGLSFEDLKRLVSNLEVLC